MTMFNIDAEGWIHGTGSAVFVSPFYDKRQGTSPLDLIVIHNISLPAGVFGTGHVAALFEGRINCSAHPSFESLRGLEVSSHFFIDRNGFIRQFVSTNNRAWHAGVSSFMNRVRCNDFSIGIELEGCDTQPFEEAQYRALSELIDAIIRRYPTIQYITGHCDIAPGRKTDPGPFFNWTQLMERLKPIKPLQYWTVL
jgi:AmpD protein